MAPSEARLDRFLPGAAGPNKVQVLAMIRIDSTFVGLQGLPGYNSLYFNGEDAADAELASDAVLAFWQATVPNFTADTFNVTVSPTAVIVEEGTGIQSDFVSVSGGTVLGTLSGNPMPTLNQICLNLFTSGVVAGRRVRGRMFLTGFTEDASDENGQILIGTRNSIQTAIANVIAAAPLVVWSRPVDGGREGSAYPVSAGQVKLDWAYLRSRRV